MNLHLIAAIQGVVEGLTEFLPVSSTGHLILSAHLLGFSGEKADTFEVFIQLGAILAVAILYRSRILDMLRRWRDLPWSSSRLTLWHVGLAMVPAVVMGLLFHKKIKLYLFSPATVLVGLVVGGVYLILAERYQPPVRAATVDDLTWRQAVGVGLFQCLALWPGFSRAGATIAGGLLLGIAHEPAAEFSFLLAVPMMVAASGKDLWSSRHLLSADDAAIFGIGFAVSFVVAWLAVVSFMRFLGRTKLTPFAWYRFALAAAFGVYMLGAAGTAAPPVSLGGPTAGGAGVEQTAPAATSTPASQALPNPTATGSAPDGISAPAAEAPPP
ncbi:MAG: undecaprenyl-diphosphate phosphatase [Candidatus Riflebacteria bacterium]|nr:undecaprenyl-diphosphate phosphatase [Candidatus Riflebacteria bacterium]